MSEGTRQAIGKNVLTEILDGKLIITVDLTGRWKSERIDRYHNAFTREWVASTRGTKGVMVPDGDGILRDSRLLINLNAYYKRLDDESPAE